MNTFSIILIIVVILLLCVIVMLYLKMTRDSKAATSSAMRLLQLETKVGSLQLETLESRLNPHLFKNVLNSIQSHAYQTYHALDKLANVLDYILYESRNKLVSAKEEIEFATNLIEINKIKLSPLFELNVKVKTDESALYYQDLLAPLISIDLIENAFKHADLQSSDSFITIVFGFSHNIFSLSVSNKISAKQPMKKNNSGVGSNTLEQRLRIIYGEAAKLERFAREEVYIANLKINLRDYQNTLHTA